SGPCPAWSPGRGRFPAFAAGSSALHAWLLLCTSRPLLPAGTLPVGAVGRLRATRFPSRIRRQAGGGTYGDKEQRGTRTGRVPFPPRKPPQSLHHQYTHAPRRGGGKSQNFPCDTRATAVPYRNPGGSGHPGLPGGRVGRASRPTTLALAVGLEARPT